jgi:ribosome-binding ATPase
LLYYLKILPKRFFLGSSPRRVFFIPVFQGKFTYSGTRNGMLPGERRNGLQSFLPAFAFSILFEVRMKLGLVGYPQVGKKTLFRLLTGTLSAEEAVKGEYQGFARVRDERFERLVEMYRPKMETPAQMEFTLLPDLDWQSSRNAPLLKSLESVDVICHLVRIFQDDSVFHAAGTVDPRRDIVRFNEEIQLYDLLFVEKRLERALKDRRKQDPRKAQLETGLLERMKGHLESGGFLKTLSLSDEEQRLVANYPPLLTRKAMIIVLNVGEEQLTDPRLADGLTGAFPEGEFQWIGVSAKIEQELSLLDAGERQAFLEELGIEKPALDKLTLLCFRNLGLISFFTVGPDEVRAWTNRRGSSAPQAARVIHSDIERGFIRAEVIKYEDLVKMGSEQKVKEAGRLMQKGKDYVVEDGDIINFLFNV